MITGLPIGTRMLLIGKCLSHSDNNGSGIFQLLHQVSFHRKWNPNLSQLAPWSEISLVQGLFPFFDGMIIWSVFAVRWIKWDCIVVICAHWSKFCAIVIVLSDNCEDKIQGITLSGCKGDYLFQREQDRYVSSVKIIKITTYDKTRWSMTCSQEFGNTWNQMIHCFFFHTFG